LIKTGTMRLQVNDVQTTSTKAKKLIKNHKGYIVRIDASDDNDVYINLQVRVPKQCFLKKSGLLILDLIDPSWLPV